MSDLQSSEYQFVGVHFVATYAKCADSELNDPARLNAIMKEAVNASGATFLGEVEYRFIPHGYTSAIILSESHATIHTYPEQQSCFVDLFTCGTRCSHAKFDAVLRANLKPQSVTGCVLKRGDTTEIIEMIGTADPNPTSKKTSVGGGVGIFSLLAPVLNPIHAFYTRVVS